MTNFEIYRGFATPIIASYNDLEYIMVAIKTEQPFYLKYSGEIISFMIDMRRKSSSNHPTLTSYTCVESSEGRIPYEHRDILYGMKVEDGKLRIYLENVFDPNMWWLDVAIPIEDYELYPQGIHEFNQFLRE